MCHRWIVSQRLLEDYHINVLHINSDGTLTNHATEEEQSEECMITAEEFKAEVNKVVRRRATGTTANKNDHDNVRKQTLQTAGAEGFR